MSDLEERLHSWLKEQGYPLEMLIARSFRDFGAYVTQSNYYIDYETNKAREIDVTAKWYKFYETFEDLAELELFCFMECKSQQSRPWLIFSSGTSEKQSSILPPASNDGRRLLRYMEEKNSSNLPEFFKLHQTAGHGLTEGFSTGRDTPYEAVMSAVKASIAKIIASDALHEEFKDDPDRVPGLHFRPVIALPIVVADSPLFECYLDETNSPVLKAIEYGAVEWKYPVTSRRAGRESIAVYIYNSSAIGTLMAHVSELNKILVGNLQGQTDELILRFNQGDSTI